MEQLLASFLAGLETTTPPSYLSAADMANEAPSQASAYLSSVNMVVTGTPPPAPAIYLPAVDTTNGAPLHIFRGPRYPIDQQLHYFWMKQKKEIAEMKSFKKHSLPLARIRKVMKGNQNVHMVTNEALVLFSRACEMFTSELTLRSWVRAGASNRVTVQKIDIAAMIWQTDLFDFLHDVVPIEEVLTRGRLSRAHRGLLPSNQLPLQQAGSSMDVEDADVSNS